MNCIDRIDSTKVIPLDLSSARRDRTVYPNPFEYETTINNAGTKSATNATDPVTLQLPIALGTTYNQNTLLQWTGTNINVTGTIESINWDEIVLVFTSPFELDYQYYRGLLMQFMSGTWAHIKEYTYLGGNRGKFVMEQIPNVLPTIGSVAVITYIPYTSFTISTFFIPKTFRYMQLSKMILYNETLNEFAEIYKYDPNTSEAIILSSLPTWTALDVYSVRKQLPYITTVTASTANSITVLDSVNTIHPGDFIKNTITGQIVIVTAVDTATNTLTYNVTGAPWALITVEILQFARDNYNNITFNSIQREAHTGEYTMRLISCIIPRDIVQGTIPYIYVEIKDVDNPNINSFMSNSIGNRNALFKATPAPFEDRDIYDRGNFIKFTGDLSSFIFKFRPSATNLKVSILDPIGRVLTNLAEDTKSPNPPNPLLQNSILLNISRFKEPPGFSKQYAHQQYA